MQLFDTSGSIRRQIRHSLRLDLNKIDCCTGGNDGQNNLDQEQPSNEGICHLLHLGNLVLTIPFSVYESMLLHLSLAASVNNNSVDPVSRFERGATEKELVVVQRVLIRRLTVLDLHGEDSIKAIQVFIGLVAINMPIGCGGIGRGKDCVLHVSD